MGKQSDFFAKYGTAVVASTSGTRIFPSVKLAQMALETGYGASIILAAKNCYGIKAGRSWTGRVISNSTFEDAGNGERTNYHGSGKIYKNFDAAIAAGENTYTLFRVYNSVMDSIRDHSALLLTARYKLAMSATTPEEQARLIKECGYATGHDYANILVSIINKYNLKEWDEKKSL